VRSLTVGQFPHQHLFATGLTDTLPAFNENPSTMKNRSLAVQGVLWMLASCGFIAALSVLGRYAALQGVPPMQIVFLRILFALLTMMPLLAWQGRSLLSTSQWPVYFTRVTISLVAMTSWFFALATEPVGKVTAIGFMAPLFATVLAIIFLGEVVRVRRWLATLTGFAGALIILRPGIVEFTHGTLLTLVSAFFMGISALYIKRLTKGDRPEKVVFITTMLMTPITLVPALIVWQWPQQNAWLALLAMGPVATLGHVFLTRAFAAADASLIVSLDFVRLPFAVSFAYALFGETIDMWTWIGAGVICAASIYIAHRESIVARKKPEPATADH